MCGTAPRGSGTMCGSPPERADPYPAPRRCLMNRPRVATSLWLVALFALATVASASEFDTGDSPTVRGPRVRVSSASQRSHAVIAAVAETTYVGFTPGH